jgi:hypothetical protein
MRRYFVAGAQAQRSPHRHVSAHAQRSPQVQARCVVRQPQVFVSHPHPVGSGSFIAISLVGRAPVRALSSRRRAGRFITVPDGAASSRRLDRVTLAP